MTYVAMELWDLAKLYKQHLGKSVPDWVLWLWDESTEYMKQCRL